VDAPLNDGWYDVDVQERFESDVVGRVMPVAEMGGWTAVRHGDEFTFVGGISDLALAVPDGNSCDDVERMFVVFGGHAHINVTGVGTFPPHAVFAHAVV